MKVYNKCSYMILLFTLLLTVIGCNSATEPIKVKEIEPGRRDYVWTVDTLNTPGGIINSIWGSSPTDVWAAGYSIYEPHSDLWHYDGYKWNMYTDINFYWTPNCMFGFNYSNIWIGGDGGDIYHYNGTQWQLYYRNNSVAPQFNSMIIKHLWGESEDNIYALGYAYFANGDKGSRSFILQYDGNEWKEVYRNNSSFQYYTMRGQNGALYIAGLTVHFDNNDTVKIFKYYKNEISEIFQDNIRNVDLCYMEIIGSQLYFMIGNRLMKYENDKFVEVLKLEYDNSLNYACGRNEKDIFFFMCDGLVHFNGTNFEYVFRFTNGELILWGPPVILEKDIFITATENIGNKTRIIHGHLPD